MRVGGGRRIADIAAADMTHPGLGAAVEAGTLRASRPDQPRDLLAVLVAAAGEVDEEDLVLAESRGELGGVGDRVGGFERGDDPLELREELEAIERLGVGDADVLDAAAVLPVRVLRADAGVIEAGA